MKKTKWKNFHNFYPAQIGLGCTAYSRELEYLPEEGVMKALDLVRIHKIQFEFWVRKFG